MQKWVLITLLAALSVTPRLFYLNVPFERDEGVYTYISDVIDRGGLPYKDAFDHKPPGVHYLYNVSFKVFGHEISSPRIMATIFVMLACLFSFALVYKITSNFFAGIFTMAFLGLTSSSPAYTGFNTNTEIFTVPFFIGGMLFLLDEEPSLPRYFLSGLLFGIGFVIKQPVLTIAVAAFACSAIRFLKTPRKLSVIFSVFALASSIPFLLFMLYFAYKGAFYDFLTGYFTYNFSYIAGPTLEASLMRFLRAMRHIVEIDPFTWCAGVAGIFLFLFLSSNKRHYKWVFLSGAIGAALSVSMGKYFYTHYFIFFIPFLAIGAGLGVAHLLNGTKKTTVLALSAVVFVVNVGINVKYFKMSAKEVLRVSYGEDMPFYQSVALGDYLRKHAGPNGTAYIIGSEPQILFYSGLKSPTRFFYFYPLIMQAQFTSSFRAETLADLRGDMPDYLIFVNNYTSHFINTNKSPFLMELFQLFSRYRLVAISNAMFDEVISDGYSLRRMELITNHYTIHIFTQAEGTEDNLAFGSIFGL